ncbi:MAG: hypothetical protein ACAI35_26405 [Candidatus Methylacidiphilales bacterium]
MSESTELKVIAKECFAAGIAGGTLHDNGKVELTDGQRYSLYLENGSNARCNVEVQCNGKAIGSYRLEAGENATVEKSLFDNQYLTFQQLSARQTTATLVQVRFYPEKAAAGVGTGAGPGARLVDDDVMRVDYEGAVVIEFKLVAKYVGQASLRRETYAKPGAYAAAGATGGASDTAGAGFPVPLHLGLGLAVLVAAGVGILIYHFVTTAPTGTPYPLYDEQQNATTTTTPSPATVNVPPPARPAAETPASTSTPLTPAPSTTTAAATPPEPSAEPVPATASPAPEPAPQPAPAPAPSAAEREIRSLLRRHRLPSDSEYVPLLLPRGVIVEVPSRWRLKKIHSEANLENSGDGIIPDFTDIALPAGKDVMFLHANTGPGGESACLFIEGVDTVVKDSWIRYATEAQLTEARKIYKETIEATCAKSAVSLLELSPVRTKKFGEHVGFAFTFKRTSDAFGNVITRVINVILDDKTFQITLIYREDEKEKWIPVIKYLEDAIRIKPAAR